MAMYDLGNKQNFERVLVKRNKVVLAACLLLFLAVGCGRMEHKRQADRVDEQVLQDSEEQNDVTDTAGSEEYRGFLLDNVLHSQTEGEIHYHIYVPDSYDKKISCALFVTLPGYEGLYFQGVGVNLRAEPFGFTAQSYDPEMIVVAPQLNDWGETSARQTIALVEYLLSEYKIDKEKVYINGYSGGGETLSLAVGIRPDLFAACLHCSSKWDGTYDSIVEKRMPVYLVIGENDEYYGSEPVRKAYDSFYKLYEQEGLEKEEIDRLLVLDIKNDSYFKEQGASNQHGGGCTLFANDEEIMGWLFAH